MTKSNSKETPSNHPKTSSTSNSLLETLIKTIPEPEPIFSWDRTSNQNDNEENGFLIVEYESKSESQHSVACLPNFVSLRHQSVEERKKKKNILKNPIHKKKAAELLLIESLIFSLCEYKEKDAEKKWRLFRHLRSRFEIFNVLAPKELTEPMYPILSNISNHLNSMINNFYEENTLRLLSPSNADLKLLNLTSQETGISRYLAEFEELELIAKGGFGVVKKARCRLDNQIYAVKQINVASIFNDFENVYRREVRVYAKLQHSHLVCYKNSWLEFNHEFIKNGYDCNKIFSKPSTISNSCDPLTNESIDESCFMEKSIQSLGISNSDSLSQHTTSLNDAIMNSDCKTLIHSGYFDKNDRASRKHTRYEATLYLQMELCGDNLRQHLDERNEKISKIQAKNSWELIEVFMTLDMFRQILKGVQFIHSKQMIHRDLKPQNILFGFDNKLKITDFGLAKWKYFELDEIASEENRLNSKWNEIDGLDRNHTTGLGTSIYAAPEQRNQTIYDTRVDIYSLGIILFELIHPLSTEMEKILLLNKLQKHGKLPDDFVNYWNRTCPVLIELIYTMTASNPDKRPTDLSFLLNKIDSAMQNLSETDSSNNSNKLIKIIENLRKELKMKDDLIHKQDQEIKALREKLKN